MFYLCLLNNILHVFTAKIHFALGMLEICSYVLDMSKQFITDVILRNLEITGVGATLLAGEIIDSIKIEIVSSGGFTLPGFGTFTVRETPKRNALNPKTGAKVAVKAGATVRFKASPVLKGDVMAGLKKAKRKSSKKV